MADHLLETPRESSNVKSLPISNSGIQDKPEAVIQPTLVSANFSAKITFPEFLEAIDGTIPHMSPNNFAKWTKPLLDFLIGAANLCDNVSLKRELSSILPGINAECPAEKFEKQLSVRIGVIKYSNCRILSLIILRLQDLVRNFEGYLPSNNDQNGDEPTVSGNEEAARFVSSTKPIATFDLPSELSFLSLISPQQGVAEKESSINSGKIGEQAASLILAASEIVGELFKNGKPRSETSALRTEVITLIMGENQENRTAIKKRLLQHIESEFPRLDPEKQKELIEKLAEIRGRINASSSQSIKSDLPNDHEVVSDNQPANAGIAVPAGTVARVPRSLVTIDSLIASSLSDKQGARDPVRAKYYGPPPATTIEIPQNADIELALGLSCMGAMIFKAGGLEPGPIPPFPPGLTISLLNSACPYTWNFNFCHLAKFCCNCF